MSDTAPCRVFLLRHGQAQMPDEQGQVWNYSEAALTPAGPRRGAQLAAAVEPVRLDAALTSNLPPAHGHTVALCSHAYVLQALLCHIVGADVSQYWTFAGLHASLTLAEVGPDGRGVLRTMNGDLGLAGLVGGRLPLRGQETSTSPPD